MPRDVQEVIVFSSNFKCTLIVVVKMCTSRPRRGKSGGHVACGAAEAISLSAMLTGEKQKCRGLLAVSCFTIYTTVRGRQGPKY